MVEPLVKAQVAVCELLQERPLNDAFRRLVLEEVNKDVLQTRVLLWSRLLQGELVQAGVLLVERLEEEGVPSETSHILLPVGFSRFNVDLHL